MFFPRQDTAPFEQRRALVEQQMPEDAEELLAQVDREERRAQIEHSLAGRCGRALEPLSKYAGFTWRENISLVGGFAAKEVIVSTLGMAYSLGELEADEDVSEDMPLVVALRADPQWSPLRAFSLLLFVMLYAPCLVTVAAIWRESGSWRWAAFSVLYSTAIAYVVAVAVYRGGLLFTGGA